MSKTHMTIGELAKLLEIKHNKISQDTKDTNLFHIKNATLKNINKGLWTKDINIGFIHCEFQEDIILPEQTELYIQPQLTFEYCSFLKNWITGRAIITKDFSCISCTFKGLMNCSVAIFLGRVNFSLTKFSNEARFINTQFNAKNTKTQETKNRDSDINFRESSFGGNVSLVKQHLKAG